MSTLASHDDVREVPPTRARSRTRGALWAALVTSLLLFLNPGASAAAPRDTVSEAYDQDLRPQFHFSAKQNWLNDPNGLVYYKGLYHLFFQHNPEGNTWGNMSWGHATSKDLVHWNEQPVAIPQTLNDDGESVEDIFSGSAVVDKNNTSGFGTKAKPPMVAVYTSAYTAEHPTLAGRQAQSLAYSTDEGKTWTKYAGNPVLDIGSREFRDPKVFWYAPAKQWRMVVVRALEHKVDIYGSPNLKKWTQLSDFGPVGATGGAWECPDLFPLAVDGDPGNIKWVMVVNLNPGGIAGGSGGQYFVGDFDGTTFTSDDPATYTPPAGTVVEDFEDSTYGSWTTTGEAFGTDPAAGNLPGQAGVAGYLGDGLANSFTGGDASRGTLTSPEFAIRQDYLNFLVGGGNHPRVAGATLDPTVPSGTVFADFEGDTWGKGWTGTGDFENDGPRAGTIGDQQEVSGYQGERLVNTFTDHDAAAGTITSPTFTIGEKYVNLLVGGGNHPYTSTATDATAVNLIVDGEVVQTVSGQDSELTNWVSWDVSGLQGKPAQIQIVDQNTGGWGHLLVDHIMFSDEKATPVSVETSVNLVVNGRVVRTATGPNSETLDWTGWDVRDLAGATAKIEIVDNNNSGFGHILADQFTFADTAAESATQRAHWLDYGRDFYAGVTFNDVPKNKRIMIAWMNNWQYGGAVPTDPWRSAMSVPRELNLGTVRGKVELRSTPVAQLKGLRKARPVHVSSTRLLPGTTTLRPKRASGDTVEIKATFRARNADKFGLNVRVGNGEKTVVGYDVHRGGLYLDRTKSGNVAFSANFPSSEFAPLKLGAHDKVKLRILVDRSSVEVFANNGRVTITDQVFPQRDSNRIQIFSSGGRAQLTNLKIWQLESSWQKRSS
jgi:fructan beta-fructosidase